MTKYFKVCFFFILYLTLSTSVVYGANFDDELVAVVPIDTNRDIGQATGGASSGTSSITSSGSYGNSNGSRLQDRPEGVSVCGAQFQKGGNISNTQSKGSIVKIALKKYDKQLIVDQFGEYMGNQIFDALGNGTVMDGGAYIYTGPIQSSCGDYFEVTTSDVSGNNFDYVDINIEVRNTDENGNKLGFTTMVKGQDGVPIEVPVASYKEGACLGDAPFVQDEASLPSGIWTVEGGVSDSHHQLKANVLNYKFNYNFQCAGYYKITYTEHMKNGTTKEPTVQYEHVDPAPILAKKPTKKDDPKDNPNDKPKDKPKDNPKDNPNPNDPNDPNNNGNPNNGRSGLRITR